MLYCYIVISFPEKMNKKNIIFGVLLVIALIVFIKKDFFAEKFDKFINAGQSYKEDVLKIVLNEPETDISPYSLDLNNKIRSGNIFEGLVAFDRNLKIVPALAVSWGNINPTTWEFKLRKDVHFHDKSDFNSKNVIDSYNNARDKIQTVLNTISEIKAVDDYNIRIITKAPDPLLLSKLTKFYIARPGNMGTGPYKIREWLPGELIDFTAFTDYWGKQPAYRNVQYAIIMNREQRKKDFENGQTDILVAVPQDQALELPKKQIKTSYGMEVNFLMFKLDDELMKNRTVRDKIKTVFDPAQIETIGNNFVRQASQFVAPGVYGYNSNIPPFQYDENKRAINLFGDRLEKIKFDYLSSYRTLSEYIIKQLKDAGFSVKSNPVSAQELIELISGNESQLFLVGWQAEDGDAQGFLDAFIYSGGEYNGGRYKNSEVDKMIEQSRQEMDPEKRLTILQNIMLKIQNDMIGIPLFESSRLYAVQPDIKWEPRLDGMVLAGEVE